MAAPTIKERLVKLETRFDNVDEKLNSLGFWLKTIGASIIGYIVMEIMRGIN